MNGFATAPCWCGDKACLVAMFRAAVLLLALVAHADCLKPAEAPRSAVRRSIKPGLTPELKPSLVPRSRGVAAGP